MLEMYNIAQVSQIILEYPREISSVKIKYVEKELTLAKAKKPWFSAAQFTIQPGYFKYYCPMIEGSQYYQEDYYPLKNNFKETNDLFIDADGVGYWARIEEKDLPKRYPRLASEDFKIMTPWKVIIRFSTKKAKDGVVEFESEEKARKYVKGLSELFTKFGIPIVPLIV